MSNLVDGQKMRDLAAMIRKQIPGVGFTLLVFPFNEAGQANYISNAQRCDMIKELENVLERWKTGNEFPTPESN